MPASEKLKWEQVASLEELMKQVPTVNATLKRGLTPQRFKTLQKQSAGQAATLAAIAQTVMADTQAVKDPADLDKWYQDCAEMRDAAGAVNAAIHADDQPATAAGHGAVGEELRDVPRGVSQRAELNRTADFDGK